VYFRVFEGPIEYHAGDDHHDAEAEHELEEEPHAEAGEEHGFHPHPPRWAINSVLVVLALATFGAIGLYMTDKPAKGFVGHMVKDSSAAYVSPYGHHKGDGAHGEQAGLDHGAVLVPVAEGAGAGGGGTFLGFDPHTVMYYVSAVVGIAGILIAYVLHLHGRREAATARADALTPYLGPVAGWARNKWYVDELYDLIFRTPLRVLSHLFHLIDKLLVDGLVNGLGALPRAVASGIRPAQSGVLQGYAVGMAWGLAVVLLIVLVMR